MTEKEYAKIIAKNLKRIAYERGKEQCDIVKDLGINQATVSSWFTGKRVPRMSKIDLLCEYFNCKRSDIMEEHADETAVIVPQIIIDVLASDKAARLVEYAEMLKKWGESDDH